MHIWSCTNFQGNLTNSFGRYVVLVVVVSDVSRAAKLFFALRKINDMTCAYTILQARAIRQEHAKPTQSACKRFILWFNQMFIYKKNIIGFFVISPSYCLIFKTLFD